jgi:Ran-binding protein 3
MKNKVRQISQGVEDITWKGVDCFGINKNEDVDIEPAPPPQLPAALGKEIMEQEPDDTMVNDYEAPPKKNEDVDTAPVPPLAPPIPLGKVTDQTKEEGSTNASDKRMADYETPPKTPENSDFSHPIHVVQVVDAAMVLASPMAPNRLRASSESNEKGLKRKYLERGTSHGPPESGEASVQPKEPLKRPRDGSEKDDNPREAKRPSPPPSPPRPSPPSPKVPKSVGQ